MSPLPQDHWTLRQPRRRPFRGLILALGLVLSTSSPLTAADLEASWTQLRTGNYEDAVREAEEALTRFPREPEWHLIRMQGLMTTGKVPEAYLALTNALATLPRNLPIRWLGRDVLAANGRVEESKAQLQEVAQLVTGRPSGYRDVAELVIFGQAALESGADPKTVFERIFEIARKADPKRREPYLAAGQLALDKHDFALAARRFDEGLKQIPDDADLHYGRALAFASSDRQEMAASLATALKINPRHIPSLVLMAGQRIDAEDYDGARERIQQIQKINPVHPDAAAFQAVIAHLKHEPAAEQAARELALRHWTNNPAVPHRIGAKLSQKYRFAEGAALQREALSFDRDYLPAKAQLANDLLRLGDEAEGWELVQEVYAKDGYDVTMFNLVTLRDTLTRYTTLTNAHFTVRMDSKEARIYGPRVLALLERARSTLTTKYGAQIADPTLVEIFADSKDFGVRTFGMPDNPGYLGVCFGRVVTANSPATNPGGTVNWEAVLWHEYCHVVTLQMTRNKMPRWLSEGISVHEERQVDPSWGEQLTPKYREMILGGELTPISRLSAAFLMPKTPLHLQFAYYEASLVVEFLIQRYGAEAIRAVLNDLRDGQFINTSLERHTAPMETLESEFAAFARAKAEGLAPGLAWDRPEFSRDAGVNFESLMETWAGEHPTNFWALDFTAETLIERKEWEAAKVPLQALAERFPQQTGGQSALARLARVHRALGETNAEMEVLTRVVQREAAAPEACQRLMELAAAAQNWTEVARVADRYLAVNPLSPGPYRLLGEALQRTGAPERAIGAYQTLLELDPPDPGRIHDQLARLYLPTDRATARKHTVAALEDAPRNREALRRLLELTPNPPGDTVPATPNPR